MPDAPPVMAKTRDDTDAMAGQGFILLLNNDHRIKSSNECFRGRSRSFKSAAALEHGGHLLSLHSADRLRRKSKGYECYVTHAEFRLTLHLLEDHRTCFLITPDLWGRQRRNAQLI